MKNLRFIPRLAAGLFTLTAGVLPLAGVLVLQPAAARSQESTQTVSFDFFYSGLADNGDWYNTPDFGYVFQPYIAYKNEAWRPYTDGYWAETDQGWTWVSYEDFGWACYHYGRWSQLENVGWVWVPGYEWGPGWVSWRTSDEYIGWAPLPPKSTQQVAATTVERTGGARVIEEEETRTTSTGAGERVYQGRLLRPEDVEDDYDTGYNGSVDVRYDIGPGAYSFVPVRSFGAPYLVEVVVPVAQNVIIIGDTTNVTNIVYRRGPRDERLLYCGGPDYALVSRRVDRPIPRLLLDRRTDIGNDRAALRADRFNIVRDNRLEIIAPLVARRPVDFTQVRPVRVKESLVRPQIIHGWRGAQQQDPRLVERLRADFQQQARQAPPARQVAENFVTPAAFRAQPPPSFQEQQRQHQPPPPRTAEGGRFNGAPGGQPPATPPGAPPGQPFQPGVVARPPQGGPPQPVPGLAGRNLSDADRQARRDAQQREFEQRQGNRPPVPQPANPPAPPVVANAERSGTPPASPNGQPPKPNRTAEERDAYRAAKQQPARPVPAPAPAENANPGTRVAPQPFQKEEAKPERTNRPAEQTPARPSNPPRENKVERERQETPPPRTREPQPAPERARPAPEPRREQPPEPRREPQRREPPAEPAPQREAHNEGAARAREGQEQQQRETARRQAPPEQPRRPAPEAARPPQPGQKPGEEGKKHGEKEQP